MATEQPGFEPARLFRLVDPRRKSVQKSSPKRGIPEASVEESMERNQPGGFGQDRGQLPQALEGLH